MESYKTHEKQEGRKYPFALIVDECDALIRTKDGSPQMEQSLHELCKLRSSLHMMISATPTLALLFYVQEYTQELHMFSLDAGEDYVGIGDMKPPQNVNGDEI